jgi:hypothetical protein
MQVAPRRRKSFAVSVRTLVAFLTASIAWLVVLSQGASTLHFALISHGICADHGEVVHEDGVAHSPGQHVAGTAAQAPDGHAGHDHCPVLGRRLEPATLHGSPTVTVSEPGATAFVSAAATNDTVPSRAELLLAAPKQSPPV